MSTYRYPSPIELAREKMQKTTRRDDKRKWRATLGGLTAAANRQREERTMKLEICVETVEGERRHVSTVETYGRADREMDGLIYSRSQAYRRVYALDERGREVAVPVVDPLGNG